MVGGGRGAFIGAVHRFAARLDDELRARRRRALGRSPRTPALSGRRSRPRARPRLCRLRARWRAREAARPDGIEAVAIVTPNHLHHPDRQSVPRGRHRRHLRQAAVDHPERGAGARRARAPKRPRLRGDAQQHRLRHGAAGARDDRRRRARRAPPRPRRLYAGLADRRRSTPRARSRRSGAPIPRAPAPRPCLADIGVHAHNLAAFVTGLELDEVAPISPPSCPAGGSTTTPMCCCATPAARAACCWRARWRPATSTRCRSRSTAARPGSNGSARRPSSCASRRTASRRARCVRGGPGNRARGGPRLAHAGRPS